MNILDLWNIVEVNLHRFQDNFVELYRKHANIQKHRKGVCLKKKKLKHLEETGKCNIVYSAYMEVVCCTECH